MIEPIKATQRTIPGWSSRPNASKITPNAMGVQIARLNNPMFFFSYLSQTKYVMSTKMPKIMTRA